MSSGSAAVLLTCSYISLICRLCVGVWFVVPNRSDYPEPVVPYAPRKQRQWGSAIAPRRRDDTDPAYGITENNCAAAQYSLLTESASA
jgi:hypothetical protein